MQKCVICDGGGYRQRLGYAPCNYTQNGGNGESPRRHHPVATVGASFGLKPRQGRPSALRTSTEGRLRLRNPINRQR